MDKLKFNMVEIMGKVIVFGYKGLVLVGSTKQNIKDGILRNSNNVTGIEKVT